MDGLDPREAIPPAAVGELARGVAVGVVARARPRRPRGRGGRGMRRGAAEESGLDLGGGPAGGVFQNRRLLARHRGAAGEGGVARADPQCLPPNDGGIAYGHPAVAAAALTVPADAGAGVTATAIGSGVQPIGRPRRAGRIPPGRRHMRHDVEFNAEGTS